VSTDDTNTIDKPWDDSPDDDAAIEDALEPDPAEVVGSDESPRDRAAHPINDPNVRESLDERLAEEDPDRPVHARAGDAVQLILGADDEDADEAEGDDDGDDQSDLDAEEAAVHLDDTSR
jgi:hypothetical protein